MTLESEMLASEDAQARLVARAEAIIAESLRAHEGNIYAALVELAGSDAVADLLIGYWGSETLALNKAARDRAGKE